MADRPGDARAALTPRPAQECRERLSPTPQPVAGQIQIFGRRDSRDTQKALRFFSERRIHINFVDLAVKPIAPAELRRFTSRHGARAVLDERSQVYRERGLAYLRLDDDELFDRLLADQQLIVLPLVRAGNDVVVGLDEKAWRSLLPARNG